MNKNFLLIVEGNKPEKDLFSRVFEKYGFNVIRQDIITIPNGDDIFKFDRTNFVGEKSNIVIINGPKNRISEFINLFDGTIDSLDNLILDPFTLFAGVFLIYDVDHTSKEKLKKMFDKFQNETDNGLLLVSSPCIEILGDTDRKEEIKVNHLEEYKKERNNWATNQKLSSYQDYLINNFEKLALYYLDKNTIDSGNNNVMDHPSFVIEMINNCNERKYIDNDHQPVIYRYFTTVVYVCVAFINGLTKDINNVEIVKQFFEKHNNDGKL